MRERHSDMLEAYIKLAEEKGLVKKAVKEDKKDKESSELKKYKTDAYARIGSDDISTIEALYGVKPQTLPGMDYENNIAEIAHPNAIVISPAYDKINGLVENINERANIIHNKIMSNAPSGNPFFLKDAKNDLTMQLIRIANDMDNANEEELRILADECLEEMKKEADWMDDAGNYAHKLVNWIAGNKGEKALTDAKGIGEGALAGAALGAGVSAILWSWTGPGEVVFIPAGAILGGIVGALFNTSPKVKNIKENAKDLLDQVNDIKKAVPEQAPFFQSIEDLMARLVKASDEYLAALDMVRVKEARNEAPTEAEKEELKKDSKIFVDLINNFESIRKTYKEKADAGVFAKALSSVSIPGVANDIEDVSESFNSLAVAIDNLKSTMKPLMEKVETTKPAESSTEPKKEAPKVETKQPESTDNIAQNPSSINKVWEMLGQKPDEKTMNFLNSLPEF